MVIGDRVVGVCWGAWYCSRWAGGVRWAYIRRLVRSHRVPVDHATSKVIVRALNARVHDVHAHALARQVAVVKAAINRAAVGVVVSMRSMPQGAPTCTLSLRARPQGPGCGNGSTWPRAKR